jgi:hypothetical protein
VSIAQPGCICDKNCALRTALLRCRPRILPQKYQGLQPWANKSVRMRRFPQAAAALGDHPAPLPTCPGSFDPPSPLRTVSYAVSFGGVPAPEFSRTATTLPQSLRRPFCNSFFILRSHIRGIPPRCLGCWKTCKNASAAAGRLSRKPAWSKKFKKSFATMAENDFSTTYISRGALLPPPWRRSPRIKVGLRPFRQSKI